MKKLISILFIILLTTTLFIANIYAVNISSEAFTNSRNSSPLSGTGVGYLKTYTNVNIDKAIPSEYNFSLGNKDITLNGRYIEENDFSLDSYKVSKNAGWEESVWKNAGMDNPGTPVLAQDGIKGKYSILYPNADEYNGEKIDVKATLVDFETVPTVSGKTSVLQFKTNEIGNNVIGLRWLKVKYDFYKSGTEELIEVKGNTTYWDVDSYQGIVLEDGHEGIQVNCETDNDGNETNCKEGIYITSDNDLYARRLDGAIYIYDTKGDDNSRTDSKDSFTELFQGSSITRTYQYGNPLSEDWTTGNGSIVHSTVKIESESTSNSEDDSKKLTTPVKTVDKTKVKMGEEYTYVVKQVVPETQAENYYKSFAIEDTLEDCLSVNANNVSVTDENGQNVTQNFEIHIFDQQIAVIAKNYSQDDFYGHTYSVTIKTNIKSNSNMNKYKSENNYIIPNVANTIYLTANEEIEMVTSETVNVEYTPEIVSNVPQTSSFVQLYIAGIGSLLIALGTIGTMFYLYKNERA